MISDFFQKEKIIRWAEKDWLSVISPVVNVVEFVLEKFHCRLAVARLSGATPIAI